MQTKTLIHQCLESEKTQRERAEERGKLALVTGNPRQTRLSRSSALFVKIRCIDSYRETRARDQFNGIFTPATLFQIVRV